MVPITPVFGPEAGLPDRRGRSGRRTVADVDVRLLSTHAACAADLVGPAVSVGPDASLGTVRQALAGGPDGGQDLVLVTEHGVLLGVATERDVVAALSPYLDTASEQARDLHTLRRPVHQVMEHHPVTVRPDDLVEDVARVLLAHRLSAVPVVEPTGHCVGVVGWRDVLAHVVPGAASAEPTVPSSRTPPT